MEDVPIRTDAPYDLVDTDFAQFTPANASESSSGVKNTVAVFAFKTSDTEGVLKSYVFGDKQTPTQELTINGNKALYFQDISTGATQSPTYTKDSYAITHNDITLLVTFTEKQGSDSTSGATEFDATSSVSEFKTLSKSVKFLK
jgi:hypothetical protein